MDLLPTILDALQFDGKSKDFKGNYLYEGQSVLRPYPIRLQFRLSSPGFTSLILEENGTKIVTGGCISRQEELLVLMNDPNDDNVLDPLYFQLLG